MTSSLPRPSLDEIASAVLDAMAPLGHPVAERYVRSMRSMAGTQARVTDTGGNGAEADSVYVALAALTPRERDLACLRDATAAQPRLTLARLSEGLETCSAIRGWAALIAAARQQQLGTFSSDFAHRCGPGSPLEALLPVAAHLARIEAQERRQSNPTILAQPAAGASLVKPAATPAVAAPVTAPIAATTSRLAPTPEPTPRLTERAAPAGSLAETVSALEATARKTADRAARAALYHRIGLFHSEQLGAPRSALESHLLAFMLDPIPFDHFVAVERACREMDRHKDLVHIYLSAVDAMQDGAAYPLSVAELLWRCLQTQQVSLLRDADAENTAARLALEPSADEAMLRRLQAWLTDRSPANDALIALVSSRLPSP